MDAHLSLRNVRREDAWHEAPKGLRAVVRGIGTAPTACVPDEDEATA